MSATAPRSAARKGSPVAPDTQLASRAEGGLASPASSAPPAWCVCRHPHETVTIDDVTNVFHRCREKYCDCNEFRPEPPDTTGMMELLDDAERGAALRDVETNAEEFTTLLQAYRDSVAHTTRWEYASQTRRLCPELTEANEAEGTARDRLIAFLRGTASHVR